MPGFIGSSRALLTSAGSLIVLPFLAVVAAAQPAPSNTPSGVVFFEKKIRPLLVSHCYTCHSADTNPHGGLRVDDRNGLLTGGKSGPAIVPGKPNDSLLLRRVTQKDARKRMPREGKPLTPQEISDLKKWIADGAAWPPLSVPATLGLLKPRIAKLKREHWAWQPLTNPPVPAVRAAGWPRSSVDHFLLAALEAKGLAPVADADRATLLRRVTFDLTGLPPTSAELEAFQNDRAADAFARVVDRLLASPRFGERWGRHWLDVARYGESTGPSRNIPYPHAWRYRDYVIDSVNADVPFDRFIQEQIAGDLLPASSPRARDRLLTATGFLALGVKDVNQRFKVRFDMDNVDEQIDAVCRGFLALTVTCARCHDHKFDPIPAKDYYALAGIFTSTDNCAGVRNKMGGGGLDYYNPAMLVRLETPAPPPPADQVRKLRDQVAKAKAEWDAIRGTPKGLARGTNGQPRQRQFRVKYERLKADLQALTDPASRGYAVHGVREARKIGDTQLRIRGVAENLGPVVPRGFLTTFPVPDTAPVNRRQSGRLELAYWLSSPRNPLTARVFVNRVWQHLFGQGLVTTVDNFGSTGAAPSHPQLLDHLAQRFRAEGWSLKQLVRTVVLSRAYQLAGDAPARHRALDPDNRLVWRHSPRRLDAEEMRDTLLATAGTINHQRPAGSPAMTLKMVEMADNSPQARLMHTSADDSTTRSVYLPLLRGVTPHTMEAFDPVDQTLVTGRRSPTTVPAQELYLLNAPFVRRQAQILARRLLEQPGADDRARVRHAYQLVLGRLPLPREVERVQAFLADYELAFARELPQRAAKLPAARPARPGGKTAQPPEARAAAWSAFVQALFGSAEFRYLK